jgi:hypothetical protein
VTAPFSVEVTASICFQAIDRFAPRRMPSAKRFPAPAHRAKSIRARGPPGPRKDASAGSDNRRCDAHRVFTAAQNCSVSAVVSSVTFQPFVSAFSLANFCPV